MAVTQRIERLVKAIADEYSFRYPADTVVFAYDANSDLYLHITTAATNDHYVRVKPETAPESGKVDGLGLTQRVYCPDVIQIGIDTGAADIAVKFSLTAICALKGTRVEYYEKAPIALADMVITDASLKAQFNNLEWGLLAQM